MSDIMEKDKDASMPVSKDSQINVVVNHAGEGDAIDLVRVFQNMKRGAGVFGWLTVLFVIIGICLPLLLHGFKKPELRVAAVVTLDYDVPDEEGKDGEMIPVANLTAPDGEELDLSQITSSYVLTEAVAGLSLPEKVTVANIRSNIKVERILTEDSRRQQEIASKMLADKNNAAYAQLQSVKLTYVNQFVVSLDNGFGDGKKVYLKDDELRLLLDRILESYNDYLAMTYADQKIPGDEIAVIDTDALDLMESIDLLKSAVTELYDYCDSRTDEVKDYRSARDGRSLRDLMETINTVMDVNVNYLSSYVYANSIAEDMDTMLSKYRYLLRETESKLEVANQTIATTDELIANYKPDRVLVGGQDQDGVQSTSVTTDYYNELMTTQAENYQLAAELEIEIADIKDKIANLERGNTTVKTEKAKEELKAAIETCHEVYLSVRAQMEEINGSAFYTKYADATAAQGERLSFISANKKKLILGVALGLFLGLGIWFVAAFAEEMKRAGSDKKGEVTE